jgi:peptidoglycan-associated lipoprotein
MQKKVWMILTLLLVIPAMMMTVSCQKKTVAVAQEPVMEEKPAPPPPPPPAGPSEEDQMIAMIMQEDVYFEFDKSTLTPVAQETLTRKAEYLRKLADVTVTIEGHCDERGTNEYNLALGDRRAESAKAFLVQLGIEASRMTTISYGEERPVCMEQNEECWAKNRRDHFVVNK